MKSNLSKNRTLYGGVFVLLSFIIIIAIYYSGDKTRVCYENKCFAVEVADNSKEREKGLMYRRRLDSMSGMLFVFENSGRYSFWMKNTYIPLDIIWIDEDHRVVYVKEDAKPAKDGSYPTVHPDKDASYVLELNAGKVSEIGLKVGSEMKFEGNVK